METLVINSEKELKAFVEKNRKRITNINGVSFGQVGKPIFSLSIA